MALIPQYAVSLLMIYIYQCVHDDSYVILLLFAHANVILHAIFCIILFIMLLYV